MAALPQQFVYPYKYPQTAFTPDFQTTQIPFPPAQAVQQGPAGYTNAIVHNEHPALKPALKRSGASRKDHGMATSRHGPRPKREEERRRGRGRYDGLRPVDSIPSRREERSISRRRTNSKMMFIPDRILVTFKGGNELVITNMVEETAKLQLAEAVLHMWPDGHDEMDTRYSKLRVVLPGSPWTAKSSGSEGITAPRTIRNIFIQLALLDFKFTIITNSNQSAAPSLLFTCVPPELYPTQTTDFFILSISRSYKRLTFIEAPESIVRNLAVDMKQYFPYQVAPAERGVLVFEIRSRVHGTPRLDHLLFIGWLLEYTSLKCNKKELWVFRRKGQLRM